MKKWLFGQFVAGEHLECLRPVIERQHRSGVRSILDYAVEEDIGNKQEEIKMKPRYGSRGGERGGRKRWFSAGQATCGPGYLRQEVLNDACNKVWGDEGYLFHEALQ